MKGENSAQPAAGKGGESRMTGKDLFAALSFVDDALILEAEEAKPARRAFPAQAVTEALQVTVTTTMVSYHSPLRMMQEMELPPGASFDPDPANATHSSPPSGKA